MEAGLRVPPIVANRSHMPPESCRALFLIWLRPRDCLQTLATTKFADSPMVGVAARPGGGLLESQIKDLALVDKSTAEEGGDGEEGGAGGAGDAGDAGDAGGAGGEGGGAAAGGAPEGIEDLLATLRASIRVPERNPDGPLLFAIDHCFPIKGQGTVLTGTVLSGAMKVRARA